MTPERTGDSPFQTTHWTVVLQAAQPNPSDPGGKAFAELYLAYWQPLYGYVRRRGWSREEAEDITQDFFARLISKDSLNGITRSGGKFRSFLLATLENFLNNQWDKAQAQKRGGGKQVLSLNVDEGEAQFAVHAVDGETPEIHFEKRWAFTLLEHVTDQLRQEYCHANKRELFERLRVYLQGDRSGPGYAATAAECGMSEGALKVAVHRMRQRYGQLLRHAIARTVSSAAEVEEELRYLISVVGR